MMRYRLFPRISLIAFAAIVIVSCEEEPTDPFHAFPKNVIVEVREDGAGTASPCPRFYFYKVIPDRAGDDRYCARILERCMGPNGRPQEGCL